MNTYLLSKLLPLIFSPLGIVLILISFFIIRKKRKFIYSAFSILIIFSNGISSSILLKILENPWERLDYSVIEPADGIVVLSGGGIVHHDNTKIIEWIDPDRFLAGVELYRAKKSNKLIFTRGASPLNSYKLTEGDIYRREAMSMGVPRNDILTTYRVFNTLNEAKAVKKILREKLNSNPNNIILVTSAFHMHRAKRLFEREGISIIPYPVDFKSNKINFQLLKNPLIWIPNAKYLQKSSMAIREIIGRIIYSFY